MKLLFFAGLREALGCSAEELALPAEVRNVAQLRDHLAARGAPWDALLRMRNLRVAVNQRMVGLEAGVAEGDEVAFFPPVTGG